MIEKLFSGDAASSPGASSADKWRYVLVHGVLLWGYPVGLLVSVVDLFPPAIHAPDIDSGLEGVSLLLAWTVAGILFGIWRWRDRCEN